MASGSRAPSAVAQRRIQARRMPGSGGSGDLARRHRWVGVSGRGRCCRRRRCCSFGVRPVLLLSPGWAAALVKDAVEGAAAEAPHSDGCLGCALRAEARMPPRLDAAFAHGATPAATTRTAQPPPTPALLRLHRRASCATGCSTRPMAAAWCSMTTCGRGSSSSKGRRAPASRSCT